MLFDALWTSAQRGELILVDSGLCHYHLRRDQQLTIREIIVLPERQRQGIASAILDTLIRRHPTATSIFAKCPADLPANHWYKAAGFTLEDVDEDRRRPLNHWRLHLSEDQP